MNPIEFEILKNTLISIPRDMGIALRRTAYSPNIKERMDASCALFDAERRLLAQAEHIPVHLGSLPATMSALENVEMEEGDQIVVNATAFGGTHLPDVTLVKPVFYRGEIIAYVVNRAHHADIGGYAPGSMPGITTEVFQEGLIIPPCKLVARGRENRDVFSIILANTRTPRERLGDLRAQIAANNLGERAVLTFVEKYGLEKFMEIRDEMMEYSRRMTLARLRDLPRGRYGAEDFLDGDGVEDSPVRIKATVEMRGDGVTVDFAGTDPQRKGNVNCPIAVTRSCVYYVFRCLLGVDIVVNQGYLSVFDIRAPEGSVVNASGHAAVAAGNVETSQRIVDVLLLALSEALPGEIPAQSQGTMNNLCIGNENFTYYETIGGGAGATPHSHGTSAVHTHMTNTMNTPVEVIETSYPLRVLRYSIRDGSGGEGRYRGGDGIIREIMCLQPATLSIQSERRAFAPRGAAGGGDGKPGLNLLLRGGKVIPLRSKTTVALEPGDVVRIETPGGGGYGRARG